MKEELALPANVSTLASKLNVSVGKVVNSKAIEGFEKAFLIASATGELKAALTPEYMKPIMELQGNRLGFKTDKDDKEGYPVAVVKNCLIEAVLMGVQPFGNQFNIIAGNAYITAEGFGYLLKNVVGESGPLWYETIPSLPRISQDKTSAACTMKITWRFGAGEKQVRDIEFAIKCNSYMGADAVIGKAKRKARAWLYNSINGVEIPEGDVTDTGLDAPAKVVKEVAKSRISAAMGEEAAVISIPQQIESCESLLELDDLYEQTKDAINYTTEFNEKRGVLKKALNNKNQ